MTKLGNICDHNRIRRTCPDCLQIERSCSVCTGYAPVALMHTLDDGRVACEPCRNELRRQAAEKSQERLFESQPSLLDLMAS